MMESLDNIKDLMNRIDESYHQSIMNESTVSDKDMLDEVVYHIFDSYVLGNNCRGYKNGKFVYNVPKYTYFDLTNEIKEYINLDNNKDILNSEMSARALQLHAKIMNLMWGYNDAHERENLRRAFAKVLSAIRVWITDSRFFVFECKEHHGWACIRNGGKSGNDLAYIYSECSVFDGYDEDNDIEIYNSLEREYSTPISHAVGFSKHADYNTVNFGDYEYREGSHNGSSGHYIDPGTTSLKKSTADEIRKMGLVPCIVVTGSYHENFFSLLGVYPQCWQQFKSGFDDDSLITRES